MLLFCGVSASFYFNAIRRLIFHDVPEKDIISDKLAGFVGCGTSQVTKEVEERGKGFNCGAADNANFNANSCQFDTT